MCYCGCEYEDRQTGGCNRPAWAPCWHDSDSGDADEYERGRDDAWDEMVYQKYGNI